MNQHRAIPVSEQQRKSNLRLGLILAAIAAAIFVAFILKSAAFGL